MNLSNFKTTRPITVLQSRIFKHNHKTLNGYWLDDSKFIKVSNSKGLETLYNNNGFCFHRTYSKLKYLYNINFKKYDLYIYKYDFLNTLVFQTNKNQTLNKSTDFLTN